MKNRKIALFITFIAVFMSVAMLLSFGAFAEGEFAQGDVDGNGSVDQADVERLMNYFAEYNYDTGTSTVEIPGNANMDNNPNITLVDLVLLREFVAANAHVHSWADATCTTPKTCTTCGATEGEANGHAWEDADCDTPKTCTTCGATEGEANGHVWADADCDTPKTCTTCGATEGEANGHTHVKEETTKPTCTEPGLNTFTCACGDSYTEDVEALGHTDADTDYKCDTCSAKVFPADGTALTITEAIAVAKAAGTTYTTEKYYITGIVTNVYNTQYGNMYLKDENGNQLCIYGLYTWNEETRYDAMDVKPVEGDELTVYTVLGMYGTTTQGKYAWIDEHVAHEHNYSEATCKAPATCTICGATTGEKAPHAEWNEATCTTPKTCKACGVTEGDTIDHVFVDGVCSGCGQEEAVVGCDHEFVNNVCTNCGGVYTVSYVLVTDASTLNIGDKIIIAAKDSSVAMSTTQNTNNRGQVAITKNGNSITIDSNVQIITLEAGTVGETFAFKVSDGYLYAASSSSNHLKTQKTNNDNGSWNITISNGVANIIGQGTYTNKTMQYNQTSSLFSCYGGATQKALVIYVEVAHVLQDVTETPANCTTAGSRTGTCIICGENVTEVIPATGHSYGDWEITLDPTCTEKGEQEKECACGDVVTEEIKANECVDDDGNNKCDVCTEDMGSSSAPSEETLATFELGANGSASHSDGSTKTTYSETVDGYTLSITNGSQFYTGARDAKGNSCIKLGSSKNAGSFKFTVNETVTKVVIYVAAYKTTAAKLTINGVSYTASTASDNGSYTAIEIDTTSTKTISVSTASGGFRCMINSIEFIG